MDFATLMALIRWGYGYETQKPNYWGLQMWIKFCNFAVLLK